MNWVLRATPIVALLLYAPVALADGEDKPADTKPETKQPDQGELSQTVPTKKSRAALSQYLVKGAEKAVKDRKWAVAIPLYQALAVARGPASPEAKQLATLWTLAGQNQEAAEAWTSYAAVVKDAKAKADATAEATRLTGTPDPFADKLALTEMSKEAKQAFTQGRSEFKAGRYGDALVLFHMGYALAPEMPGFLRELGSTYDKLGEGERKKDFYRRYLVSRPFGANADVVRSELARQKDVLGTLLVSASLPCEEMWVNRQRISGKLPEKGLLVAPGTYKGLCFNTKYAMAMFEYTTVEAGKPSTMTFRWAIIVNKLEKPYGRIALEIANSPGVMNDLGITSPEVGVPVPSDGHKLRMVLKDDSGVRTEERSVQLEPGQKLVVQW